MIKVDSAELACDLSLVENSRGVVIFAHGSGSGRLSPRNEFVSETLSRSGFCTVLFDLLTEREDRLYDNRFDIQLLADRLLAATRWVIEQPEISSMHVGYFGASTGAAAALQASTELGSSIRCVVSRGGRPDLALPYLYLVRSPTLLIVGGNDDVVLQLNREALELITAPKELSVVPGATHLFEEPGALEEVARLAAAWFLKHL